MAVSREVSLSLSGTRGSMSPVNAQRRLFDGFEDEDDIFNLLVAKQGSLPPPPSIVSTSYGPSNSTVTTAAAAGGGESLADSPIVRGPLSLHTDKENAPPQAVACASSSGVSGVRGARAFQRTTARPVVAMDDADTGRKKEAEEGTVPTDGEQNMVVVVDLRGSSSRRALEQRSTNANAVSHAQARTHKMTKRASEISADGTGDRKTASRRRASTLSLASSSPSRGSEDHRRRASRGPATSLDTPWDARDATASSPSQSTTATAMSISPGAARTHTARPDAPRLGTRRCHTMPPPTGMDAAGSATHASKTNNNSRGGRAVEKPAAPSHPAARPPRLQRTNSNRGPPGVFSRTASSSAAATASNSSASGSYQRYRSATSIPPSTAMSFTNLIPPRGAKAEKRTKPHATSPPAAQKSRALGLPPAGAHTRTTRTTGTFRRAATATDGLPGRSPVSRFSRTTSAVSHGSSNRRDGASNTTTATTTSSLLLPRSRRPVRSEDETRATKRGVVAAGLAPAQPFARAATDTKAFQRGGAIKARTCGRAGAAPRDGGEQASEGSGKDGGHKSGNDGGAEASQPAATSDAHKTTKPKTKAAQQGLSPTSRVASASGAGGSGSGGPRSASSGAKVVRAPASRPASKDGRAARPVRSASSNAAETTTTAHGEATTNTTTRVPSRRPPSPSTRTRTASASGAASGSARAQNTHASGDLPGTAQARSRRASGAIPPPPSLRLGGGGGGGAARRPSTTALTQSIASGVGGGSGGGGSGVSTTTTTAMRGRRGSSAHARPLTTNTHSSTSASAPASAAGLLPPSERDAKTRSTRPESRKRTASAGTHAPAVGLDSQPRRPASAHATTRTTTAKPTLASSSSAASLKEPPRRRSGSSGTAAAAAAATHNAALHAPPAPLHAVLGASPSRGSGTAHMLTATGSPASRRRPSLQAGAETAATTASAASSTSPYVRPPPREGSVTAHVSQEEATRAAVSVIVSPSSCDSRNASLAAALPGTTHSPSQSQARATADAAEHKEYDGAQDDATAEKSPSPVRPAEPVALRIPLLPLAALNAEREASASSPSVHGDQSTSLDCGAHYEEFHRCDEGSVFHAFAQAQMGRSGASLSSSPGVSHDVAAPTSQEGVLGGGGGGGADALQRLRLVRERAAQTAAARAQQHRTAASKAQADENEGEVEGQEATS